MSKPEVTITMSVEDADRLAASIADVMCWFLGFRAASKRGVPMPPGLDDVRDLKIILNSAARRAEKPQ